MGSRSDVSFGGNQPNSEIHKNFTNQEIPQLFLLSDCCFCFWCCCFFFDVSISLRVAEVGECLFCRVFWRDFPINLNGGWRKNH